MQNVMAYDELGRRRVTDHTRRMDVQMSCFTAQSISTYFEEGDEEAESSVRGT